MHFIIMYKINLYLLLPRQVEGRILDISKLDPAPLSPPDVPVYVDSTLIIPGI